MKLEKTLDQMIQFMKLDIDRHVSKSFKDIGKEFYGHFLSRDLSLDAYVAANFWEAWVDEKDHNFQGMYLDIDMNDWPTLAKEIIDCLENNRPIENKIILHNFDFSSRIKRKISVGIKIFLGTSILVILIFCLPLWYYYFKLPSSLEVQAGARIEESFRNFDIRTDSILSKNEDFKKVLCLECLPHSIDSEGCRKILSYFIAKNISPREPSLGMIGWHIRGAYLTSAISNRYNSDELYRVYFGFIATMFKVKEISAFCMANFKKNCNELNNDELLIFKGSTSTGKYYDKPLPPFDHY